MTRAVLEILVDLGKLLLILSFICIGAVVGIEFVGIGDPTPFIVLGCISYLSLILLSIYLQCTTPMSYLEFCELMRGDADFIIEDKLDEDEPTDQEIRDINQEVFEDAIFNNKYIIWQDQFDYLEWEYFRDNYEECEICKTWSDRSCACYN